MAAVAAAAALPSLDSPYPLSADQISRFRRDGHVHLPGVLSPLEVQHYGGIITSTAMGRWTKNGLEPGTRPGGERHFLQTLNLRHGHPGIMKFVLSSRLGRIVAELTGAEAQGVRIFHEQALFKEGGGAVCPPPADLRHAVEWVSLFSLFLSVLCWPVHHLILQATPLHQDQYYWPVDTEMAVGMWMPLVDVSMDMGPILFASGSVRISYTLSALPFTSGSACCRAALRGLPWALAHFSRLAKDPWRACQISGIFNMAE